MIPSDPKEEIVTHIPAMRAFAVSLTRNPTLADDLVQDAFEKAWGGLDGYQSGTDMRAWLFTILRNTFYSDRRKISNRRKLDMAVADADTSIAAAHDDVLALKEFYAAFMTLPDTHREALSLIAVAGFTYDEAAKMCGVAAGTMKSRVNRARKTLAAMLELGAENGAGREN